MVAHFLYAGIIPHVVAALAYLAGLIVAIILLVRTKARAATLALVGFALLMLITLGQIVLSIPQLTREFVRVQWLVWVLSCCCSVLDLAAIGCLIVAIWQAVTGTAKKDAAEDVAYPDEMPVGTAVLDEMPEGSPFATQKLSDADDEWEEGEIVQDAPEDVSEDTPFATQKLSDPDDEEV
jgi:hypothetical protein